jgi:hypothetical protein
MATRAELLKRQQELAEQQAHIEAELVAARDAELSSLIAAFKEHLANNAFTVEEAIALLTPAKHKRTRGASAAATKTPESVDGGGEKPEVGVIYRHPDWQGPWKATGKRTPKHVLATIKSGKTWADLRAKK